MTTHVLYSPCGRYRYLLGRRWNDEGPVLVWVMLNPSTADAEQDDPTIRRCIGFSKRWGYGGMTVVNLFALRATDDHELLTVTDPVGPENDVYLKSLASGHDVVAAWGALTNRMAQGVRAHTWGAFLKRTANRLDCLGMTASGQPKHPLFVPAATERMEYLSVEVSHGRYHRRPRDVPDTPGPAATDIRPGAGNRERTHETLDR